MNIDYDLVHEAVKKFGYSVLRLIKEQYNLSFASEQLELINHLLDTDFIVIEKPSNEDIEYFSKLAGITDSAYYSQNYIPSAHGGRTKDDNKIHIYPYTILFSDCNTNDEIISTCINSIVVHEIFHYFIRPNLTNENKMIKEIFGHFLTEGLVQYYSEEFALKNNLGNPVSNYGKNVLFVKKLLAGFSDDLTSEQIDKLVFTNNQDELLDMSSNGKMMYKEFVEEIKFKDSISKFIVEIGIDIGMNQDDEKLQNIVSHYKKIDNLDIILDDLSKNIGIIFYNNKENYSKYSLELKHLISLDKLRREMSIYKMAIKGILSIEESMIKLRKSGKTSEEIKRTLGRDNLMYKRVPDVLYHGSEQNLDVIKPNESTQQGNYVYATDNPTHALFFSVFRNSSIARAHIDEHIDEAGNYVVKYKIDERVKGALDELITDKDITIYVCDGKKFEKPQGDTFIGREWVSKSGQSITPIDKIKINVKKFFEGLEQQGLVEYDRYDKSKDWKTVIDLLSKNYSFGVNTNRGKNIQDYDLMYDKLIQEKFPEQFEFSKKCREYIKEVMATDYKTEKHMTDVEENNLKLRTIENFGNGFLLATKDETGKINWQVDEKKVATFINPTEQIKQNSDEMGNSQSFLRRSKSEIKMAKEIQEKNKNLALEKQSAVVKEKEPVLVKKAFLHTYNNGYANLLVLSLCISSISIILSLFVYFIMR